MTKEPSTSKAKKKDSAVQVDCAKSQCGAVLSAWRNRRQLPKDKCAPASASALAKRPQPIFVAARPSTATFFVRDAAELFRDRARLPEGSKRARPTKAPKPVASGDLTAGEQQALRTKTKEIVEQAKVGAGADYGDAIRTREVRDADRTLVYSRRAAATVRVERRTRNIRRSDINVRVSVSIHDNYGEDERAIDRAFRAVGAAIGAAGLRGAQLDRESLGTSQSGPPRRGSPRHLSSHERELYKLRPDMARESFFLRVYTGDQATAAAALAADAAVSSLRDDGYVVDVQRSADSIEIEQGDLAAGQSQSRAREAAEARILATTTDEAKEWILAQPRDEALLNLAQNPTVGQLSAPQHQSLSRHVERALSPEDVSLTQPARPLLNPPYAGRDDDERNGHNFGIPSAASEGLRRGALIVLAEYAAQPKAAPKIAQSETKSRASIERSKDVIESRRAILEDERRGRTSAAADAAPATMTPVKTAIREIVSRLKTRAEITFSIDQNRRTGTSPMLRLKLSARCLSNAAEDYAAASIIAQRWLKEIDRSDDLTRLADDSGRSSRSSLYRPQQHGQPPYGFASSKGEKSTVPPQTFVSVEFATRRDSTRGFGAAIDAMIDDARQVLESLGYAVVTGSEQAGEPLRADGSAVIEDVTSAEAIARIVGGASPPVAIRPSDYDAGRVDGYRDSVRKLYASTAQRWFERLSSDQRPLYVNDANLALPRIEAEWRIDAAEKGLQRLLAAIGEPVGADNRTATEREAVAGARELVKSLAEKAAEARSKRQPEKLASLPLGIAYAAGVRRASVENRWTDSLIRCVSRGDGGLFGFELGSYNEEPAVAEALVIRSPSSAPWVTISAWEAVPYGYTRPEIGDRVPTLNVGADEAIDYADFAYALGSAPPDSIVEGEVVAEALSRAGRRLTIAAVDGTSRIDIEIQGRGPMLAWLPGTRAAIDRRSTPTDHEREAAAILGQRPKQTAFDRAGDGEIALSQDEWRLLPVGTVASSSSGWLSIVDEKGWSIDGYPLLPQPPVRGPIAARRGMLVRLLRPSDASVGRALGLLLSASPGARVARVSITSDEASSVALRSMLLSTDGLRAFAEAAETRLGVYGLRLDRQSGAPLEARDLVLSDGKIAVGVAAAAAVAAAPLLSAADRQTATIEAAQEAPTTAPPQRWTEASTKLVGKGAGLKVELRPDRVIVAHGRDTFSAKELLKKSPFYFRYSSERDGIKHGWWSDAGKHDENVVPWVFVMLVDLLTKQSYKLEIKLPKPAAQMLWQTEADYLASMQRKSSEKIESTLRVDYKPELGGLYFSTGEESDQRAASGKFKQAGWQFQSRKGDCSRTGCAACAAGLSWVWFTADPNVAATMRSILTERAARAVEEHEAAINLSRATEGSINCDLPRGVKLYGYQNAGVAYALGRQSTLIADEMGLGKTPQSIVTMNCAAAVKRVLVVCPASLRVNWAREIKVFSAKTPTVVRLTEYGQPRKNESAEDRDRRFYERNLSALNSGASGGITWCVVGYEETFTKAGSVLDEWTFDAIILDEAQHVKNYDAQRSKRARELWMRAAEKRIMLTGTPIENNLDELRNLLSFIDPATWPAGEKMSKSLIRKPHLRKQLEQQMRKAFMVRRLKSDVLLDLPEKRWSMLYLDPADPDIQSAVEMWDDLKAQTGLSDDPSEDNLNLNDESVRLQAAMLIAEATGDREKVRALVQEMTAQSSGGVAFERISAVRAATGVAKVAAATEHILSLLESKPANEKSLVVWCHHNDVAEALRKRIAKAGYSVAVANGKQPADVRGQIVSDFQAGKLDVAVCTINAMGTGHTMTRANHAVFVEFPWTPAKLVQAEDRIHRIGQRRGVQIEYLVAEGTIDSRMMALIQQKEELAESTLDNDVVRASDVEDGAKAAVDAGIDRKRRAAGIADPTWNPEEWTRDFSGEKKRAAAIAWRRNERAYVYTKSEREALSAAMSSLASVCDGAREDDKQGFAASDVALGHQLGMLPESQWTDVLATMAHKLSIRYRGQLGGEVVERRERPVSTQDASGIGQHKEELAAAQARGED